MLLISRSGRPVLRLSARSKSCSCPLTGTIWPHSTLLVTFVDPLLCFVCFQETKSTLKTHDGHKHSLSTAMNFATNKSAFYGKKKYGSGSHCWVSISVPPLSSWRTLGKSLMILELQSAHIYRRNVVARPPIAVPRQALAKKMLHKC